MKPLLFNRIFFLVFVCIAIVVISTALYIQPYEGDITRLSGKTENRFGWNRPLKIFPETFGNRYSRDNEKYSGQDIVIFGDSFSHFHKLSTFRRSNWQDFLYLETGHHSFTYHAIHDPIDRWLEQTNPEHFPDVIIYQEVERMFSIRAQNEPTCQTPSPTSAATREFNGDLVTSKPLPKEMQAIQRPLGRGLEFNTAIHWLRHKTKGEERSYEMDLTRKDLFSNKERGTLLILQDSITLSQNLDSKRIVQLSCYLTRLRETIEANGRTRFIVAITPDKYSTYKSWVAAPPQTTNLIEALINQGIPMLRYDLIFSRAAGEGIVDLYLPNDTHWGHEGSRLFAAAIASQLQP